MPLKFQSCEMCDVVVVVENHAGHGFCSTQCRDRADFLGGELDKMVDRLRLVLGPRTTTTLE